jgi:GTP cyclohydrolase I
MCVMGLQQEQVVEWVEELHGESEDSSDASTIASVDGDQSTLLDMMSAVKVLLDGLGEDVTRDGLLKTPLRVAQAFQGATKGLSLCASGFFSRVYGV